LKNTRSSGVQEFRSSGVQEFRSSGVQEFRSSGVQEFRSSGVQETVGRFWICRVDNDFIEFAPLAGYSQFGFPHAELLNFSNS
jgi:hypothetical protein